MYIGGFQKFSLIDYPGKVSAIVFTSGCNFRCGYCHNPEIVIPNMFPKKISISSVINLLKNRSNKLDAVTITGGEPTIHNDLPQLITKIKKLGFQVKLDTNGTNPIMLKKLIVNNMIDYIAMDIKAPLDRYQEITNMPVNIINIKKSIKIIMTSGIPYEFRTTIVKSQLSKNDFLKIGKQINGAKLYVLQKFIPTKTNDPKFLDEKTYSNREFEIIKNSLNKFVNQCIVR